MLATEGSRMSKAPSRGSVGFAEGIKVHEYLAKQIEIAKSMGKTQKDIALELGYDKPNMIAMMKSGDVKVPLDKVPALAKALNIEPAFLMRLAMNQYWPGFADTIADVFGTVLTPNETRIVEKIREFSKNSDPALNREVESHLRAAFKK